MIIMRGKGKGASVRPHQFANDWISWDGPGGTTGIANPLSVQLEPDDWALFRTGRSSGMFWKWYRLNDDGTFTKIGDLN